ncbi:cobyrinate a,c-diamide synthase [Polymorphum gilvum]|uniref:Hydrogenobyrinate a,c-diamide synthase n=1 Tax=Polymorphum gilvum (strain LMG 25793 / CGMCC 1.9160 / SL003B-26A1) TaxID=991905 RepID=F2J5F5_POLGS|nr:cobyrinate a,c-diamide synthase [Polymorphum gilvum]ADZ72327.1 Cobalamin biosynthesis protein, cobyrinic acid A,C-diamide synthase protein [Polymorphum gilvum SL003B-26A1]
MTRPAPRALMIAAPTSGAGKTTVTLALLRAFRTAGRPIVSAKSGPDYIDPKFHEAASGAACVNLDAWAMGADEIRGRAFAHAAGADLLLVEAAMGLFDGAADGTGSAADLADALACPVVLVVDCARQAQSVAAVVRGFRDHRADVRVAAVILNRVAGARHEAMLHAALAPLALPVLGALPRSEALILPERHLGLVQAGEHDALEIFLDTTAGLCARAIDLDALARLAAPLAPASAPAGLAPLGQRIAVAEDIAFAFAYPHLLDGWRRAGADLTFFSPLADEPPAPDADAVYLPGGYPELHAGRLAAAETFRAGVHRAAARGARVFGECGGYMTLGEGLVDADGARHAMLGLLPLETSFEQRRLHLGYRRLTPLGGLPWADGLAGHEFHYATILREGAADRLFAARDALGEDLGCLGLRAGTVMGSFAHVIVGLAER